MMETGNYSHRFWSITEKWMPYRDKDGKWVKHLLDAKYGFDQYFSEIGCGASILNMKTNISPIYRMQKMTEFSEEDGELLKKRKEMK